MPTQTSRTSGVDHAMALFLISLWGAPFLLVRRQTRRYHGAQTTVNLASRPFPWRQDPAGRNSLSQHECNEVTLFRRRTFSAKHVVTISSKPFFCFLLIDVTLWIRRSSHRLNVLARARLPGL